MILGNNKPQGGLVLGAPGAATAVQIKPNVALGEVATMMGSSPVDVLIERLGGVTEIEKAAALMVEVQKQQDALKKKIKEYEALLTNAKSIASELGIKGEHLLHGTHHSLVLEVKTTNPTEITDKKKLYEFLEAKSPGLYFSLSSVAIGDLKTYVPNVSYSTAGITIGKRESVSISAKVKA